MKYILFSHGSYDDYSIDSFVIAPDDLNVEYLENYYKDQGYKDYYKEWVISEKVTNKSLYYEGSDFGEFTLKNGEIVNFRRQVYKYYWDWIKEKFNLIQIEYDEVWTGE